MDYKVTSWWIALSKEEQMILVEMLYNMNSEDYRMYGIEVDNEGGYKKIEEKENSINYDLKNEFIREKANETEEGNRDTNPELYKEE